MRFYRVLPVLAALAFLGFVFGAPAAALVRGPVNVQRCDPESGAVVARQGFVSAYYPPNPFYWQDVYGYRYYQPALVAANPTLSIDYTNVSPKTARSIEFGLVARGDLIAEVKDVGTFSPNAEIKHRFGLDRNVFPIGTALPRCVPLRVAFTDGTRWVNPRLPALRRSLYNP